MSGAEDAVTQRALARVGQVLRGKWRLDRLIGTGGMAAVYAATHRNGQRGAVKLLHLELGSHEDSRARFLREGYVANQVNHPGVVSVVDDDVAEDGSVFLVMELLEGETVEARAEARPGGRLQVAEVVAIADQLLDVLAAAHERGIVHRDLKPENIFLTRKNELKVLDFGIARMRELSTGSNATRTGAMMGTPAFMPPEQALGNWSSVDGRTDLWAVGAVMFGLLSGRAVHEAATLNKLLLAAMTQAAPPLASVAPHVPPAIAAVVDRALAFDQAHRWSDARSMQAALRSAAASNAALDAVTVLAPPPRPAALPAAAPALVAAGDDLPTTLLLPSAGAAVRAGRPAVQAPPAPAPHAVGVAPASAAARPRNRPATGLAIVAVAVAVGVGIGGVGFVIWRSRTRPPEHEAPTIVPMLPLSSAAASTVDSAAPSAPTPSGPAESPKPAPTGGVKAR